MEKKSFFKNFGSILTFAIFGTALAAIVTAMLMFVVGLLGITIVRKNKTLFLFFLNIKVKIL